ncbi:MAG: C_GCAxxG_C_C family protein [Candidatus Thorarchaeota archaeon]|nr:C_GCAxxG_C_C family protein [Candidatus Thorarchaeota archaeon]
MSEVGKRALANFGSDYSCAQSVLKAVLEYKGLLKEEFPYLAAGLGGGIAHEGNVCGAVTGGVMAIGALMSQFAIDVKGHKDQTYKCSEDFIARFREEFGTILCKELIGVDFSNPEAVDNAREDGVFENKCARFVERASILISEMFPENKV